MTNISAIRTVENNEPKLMFITDSMASFNYKPEKIDTVQKLYKTGDFLYCGTGNSEIIQEVSNKVRKKIYSNVEQVVDEIMKTTHNFGVREDQALNFLVGGKNNDDLEIYQLNTTGNTEHIDGKADYKRRGASKVNYAFDGSAQLFVMQYLNGLIDSGKTIEFNNYVEGLSLLFDLGKAGAKNSGVNDKLQIGIIEKQGTHLLYHPEVDLYDTTIWKDYLETSTGMVFDEIKQMGEFKDFNIFEKRANLSRNIGKILGSFYLSLESELRDYNNAKQYFTTMSEKYAKDEVEIQFLNFMKDKRKECFGFVTEGYNALITPDLDIKLKYISDQNTRRQEAGKKVLSRK